MAEEFKQIQLPVVSLTATSPSNNTLPGVKLNNASDYRTNGHYRTLTLTLTLTLVR